MESFNGKLRDELLNAEVFNSLLEARVLIEQWRQHYNTGRPHSSLGYQPPAPEVVRALQTQSQGGSCCLGCLPANAGRCSQGPEHGLTPHSLRPIGIGG